MVMDFWDFFWLLVWSFFFVAYLMVLFQVLGDLFRDHEMSGWLKALWVIALIVFPFLALLIYMIARGRGMAERQARTMEQMRAQTDAHIRDVAGGSSATEQIAAAKGLLDSGAITSGEFEQIKRKALA
jgi:ABC-type multidrug transport system fused ATPase/permease subunit